jgi:hypothetical protein
MMIGCTARSLHDLCDDLLSQLLSTTDASSLGRYRSASKLSVVSKSCRATLKPIKAQLAREAALELIGRGGYHWSWEASRGDAPDGEVLDLSHKHVGTLECRLLALALANGVLSHVRSLWLQDNRIDAQGVRWLARGVRALPMAVDGTGVARLQSISLGHNPFLLDTKVEEPAAAADEDHASVRAVIKLEEAAAARRIRVRLRS